MLLWHMGTAALLTYVTLGRRRIDYRFVLLGAVLPDGVDALLGVWLFRGDSGRWVAHSLLGATAVAVIIVVASRRERRLALFGIAVGWLLHLVADGMWNAPFTFLWPAFSGRFSASPREPYSWDLLSDPLAHASTWAAELAGAAALAWFFVAFRLGDPDRRAAFLRDGHLRP